MSSQNRASRTSHSMRESSSKTSTEAQVHRALDAFPFGSAVQLARAIRARKVSSVELLMAYLSRVDRLNPRINALVVDDRERAVNQARAADRALAKGAALGPLHGVPMTVKESFDLRGLPTTQGFAPMRNNLATEDALAVQRLKRAGAVIFGKTNVPLFLADFQTYNDIYGTTSNPWDISRTPGGSSGGSAAAVAAGLTALEFGSDIGGSIRNPAAYCGVYGHKSTWPIVPKRGHALARTAVAEADLSVVGPLARSAQDLALALDVTAGPDLLSSSAVRYRLPSAPKSIKGLRIAVWLDEPTAPVEESIRSRIQDSAIALRRAGAKVNFDARPEFDSRMADATYRLLLGAQMGARRPDFDKLLNDRAILRSEDQSPRAVQLRYATASYKEFFDANNRREQLRWAWRDFFSRYDVLLTPITATPAFVHDHSEPLGKRTMTVNSAKVPYFSQLFWAGLASCSYLPATVAPIGLLASNLPVGLQIIGAEMADQTTIWVAAELTKLLGGYVAPPGAD